jgi:hypothetical protein
MATAWMYFPYLTMEVKCGNEGLNIADRQNAHSSGVAVRQVVDLYRKVSRQHELNQEVAVPGPPKDWLGSSLFEPLST